MPSNGLGIGCLAPNFQSCTTFIQFFHFEFVEMSISTIKRRQQLVGYQCCAVDIGAKIVVEVGNHSTVMPDSTRPCNNMCLVFSLCMKRELQQRFSNKLISVFVVKRVHTGDTQEGDVFLVCLDLVVEIRGGLIAFLQCVDGRKVVIHFLNDKDTVGVFAIHAHIDANDKKHQNESTKSILTKHFAKVTKISQFIEQDCPSFL